MDQKVELSTIKRDDIEQFYEFDQQFGYKRAVQDPIAGENPSAQKQMEQSLYFILNELAWLSMFLQSIESGYKLHKLDLNAQEQEKKRNDQLQKAFACKLKMIANISIPQLDNMRYALQDEEEELMRSIEDRKKTGSYASGKSLQLYCRRPVAKCDPDLIYLNLYHDRFDATPDILFLPLVRKESQLRIYTDHIRRDGDKQFIIELTNEQHTFESYSVRENEIYENILIFNYFKRKEYKILDYQLTFKLGKITNEEYFQPLLYAHLLNLLCSTKDDTQIEQEYLRFIKQFILEHRKTLDPLSSFILRKCPDVNKIMN